MPVMERETVDEVAIGSTREKRKRAPARCPGRCTIECTRRSMPHFLVVVSGAACERRGMPEDSGSIRPAGAGRDTDSCPHTTYTASYAQSVYNNAPLPR